MSTVVRWRPGAPALFSFDAAMVGSLPAAGIGGYGRMRLPTEPIGNFVLTLTNVAVGSAVQIEAQNGSAVLHNSVAGSSTVVIPLSVYAAGNARNSLRIKVRKGTGSPAYQPFETLATAVVGAQSIYIGQILDE
jgi:hypothetical protein